MSNYAKQCLIKKYGFLSSIIGFYVAMLMVLWLGVKLGF